VERQKVVQKLELWRLVTSPCVFSSTPELLFGLYLVYFFRVFERQIGSNKYLVFLLFSTAFTTILEVVALAAFRDTRLLSGISLTPGPYGLIFASFVPFFFDIPISTRFKVFGAHFSDKSFVYLAGLQLLLSSWKRSLVPGICGMIAGFIYKSNVLRIRRAKVCKIQYSLTHICHALCCQS
jgi:membrane associated rhomboid family serine protease